MQYASLSLEHVYRIIKRIHGNPSEPPHIPKRGTPEFREFRSAYGQVLNGVTGERGAYLWFAKNSSGGVEYIYVGESRKNKLGIQGRLDDEFNKWYHIYWMTVFGSDQYEDEVIRMYNTPSKDYTAEVRNVSLKAGSTHFVYCSDFPDGADLKAVQDDLIQLYGNPRGNAKDFRTPPLPESQIRDLSKAVKAEFDRLIAGAQPYAW